MPGPWGAAIARLRATKGWNKKQTAKRAKITPTTYGHIEGGGHTQTSKLQQIADAFRVNIEAVLMPDMPDASKMSVRDVVAQLVREEQTKLPPPLTMDQLHEEMNRSTKAEEEAAPPEIKKEVPAERPRQRRLGGRKK